MKHTVFAACGALAVAGSLSLSAQTPTASPQTPTTAASSADKTMTVTGCLKNNDTATGAATPGAPTGAASYILANIEPSTGAASTPRSEGTMTPSTPAAAATASQYTLMAGDSSVNLSAHVNHKVRVTGRVASMASDMASTGHATDPSTARPGDPTAKPGDPTSRTSDMSHAGMGSAQTLTVTSITMVSATCTPKSE